MITPIRILAQLCTGCGISEAARGSKTKGGWLKGAKRGTVLRIGPQTETKLVALELVVVAKKFLALSAVAQILKAEPWSGFVPLRDGADHSPRAPYLTL